MGPFEFGRVSASSGGKAPRDPSSWVSGTRLDFACKGTHVITGNAFVECQADGEWSDQDNAACVPKPCPTLQPHLFSNGEIEIVRLDGEAAQLAFSKASVLHVGDEAAFGCAPGYQLGDDQNGAFVPAPGRAGSTSTCVAGDRDGMGTWEPEPSPFWPGVCGPVDCGTPPASPGRVYTDDERTGTVYGSVAEFVCGDGFVGGFGSAMCAETGEWVFMGMGDTKGKAGDIGEVDGDGNPVCTATTTTTTTTVDTTTMRTDDDDDDDDDVDDDTGDDDDDDAGMKGGKGKGKDKSKDKGKDKGKGTGDTGTGGGTDAADTAESKAGDGTGDDEKDGSSTTIIIAVVVVFLVVVAVLAIAVYAQNSV